MIKYDESLFIESSEFILNNSDLLIKSDCIVIDDVLYEHCKIDHVLYTEECFRYFFSCDDYNYVDDEEMIEVLKLHFNKKESV